MTFRYQFGAGIDTYQTHNPAQPSEAIGCYGIPDESEVATIIEQANIAQAQWRKVPGLERGEQLNQFLDAIVASADEIAESITLEQGKLLAEARGETLKGCAEGRFMVGEAARMASSPIGTGRPDFSNQILRRPRGVIFCISPWNFPAMTPLRKICPAVAFGNAVVLKPSQFTPAASYLIAEIAQQFFPENLVQIAMVSGRVASNIVATGDVHGVSFTGSVDTGRLVYAAAAQNLIPVQLELGGKNAAILNDSNDLPAAVAQIFGAAMQTSGQRCTAISRVLVHKDLAAETQSLFAEHANKLRLGPGTDRHSQMGPLCNLPHWQGVCSNTANAIADGAVAIAGGVAPDNAGEQGGYFFKPTILANVEHKSTAGQHEIFGPVLSVIEYKYFDQAMHWLNDTEFGLTSALFSNRNDLIQRFLQESDNGMLHVNHGTVPDNNMPFGGIKNSGVGAYSVGPTAANFYTSEHSAYIAW